MSPIFLLIKPYCKISWLLRHTSLIQSATASSIVLMCEGGPVSSIRWRIAHGHHFECGNSTVLLQYAWDNMDSLLVACQLLTWQHSRQGPRIGTRAHPCKGMLSGMSLMPCLYMACTSSFARRGCCAASAAGKSQVANLQSLT